jgi:hypothetical protein
LLERDGNCNIRMQIAERAVGGKKDAFVHEGASECAGRMR